MVTMPGGWRPGTSADRGKRVGRGKETKNKEERKKGSVRRGKIKSEREMKNGVRRLVTLAPCASLIPLRIPPWI